MRSKSKSDILIVELINLTYIQKKFEIVEIVMILSVSVPFYPVRYNSSSHCGC